MNRHTVLLLLILAWALPPAATLFFVARSQRRHRGQQGDRDSLDAIGQTRTTLMVAIYWLLCLSAALTIFLFTD